MKTKIYSIGIDGKMMLVGMGYILACIICVITLVAISVPASVETMPIVKCVN